MKLMVTNLEYINIGYLFYDTIFENITIYSIISLLVLISIFRPRYSCYYKEYYNPNHKFVHFFMDKIMKSTNGDIIIEFFFIQHTPSNKIQIYWKTLSFHPFFKNKLFAEQGCKNEILKKMVINFSKIDLDTIISHQEKVIELQSLVVVILPSSLKKDIFECWQKLKYLTL